MTSPTECLCWRLGKRGPPHLFYSLAAITAFLTLLHILLSFLYIFRIRLGKIAVSSKDSSNWGASCFPDQQAVDSQSRPVVGALELKSEDPGFKFRSCFVVNLNLTYLAILVKWTTDLAAESGAHNFPCLLVVCLFVCLFLFYKINHVGVVIIIIHIYIEIQSTVRAWLNMAS